jgi:hypothetical protein
MTIDVGAHREDGPEENFDFFEKSKFSSGKKKSSEK